MARPTFIRSPLSPALCRRASRPRHSLSLLIHLQTTMNSSITSSNTALLLGGILYAKQYFDGTNSDETNIRTMADGIFNRVDWNWMARGTNAVSMGWVPPNSFIPANWIGYNEGMIIYCLGLGA